MFSTSTAAGDYWEVVAGDKEAAVAAGEGSQAAAGDREAAARGSPVAALGSSAAAQCIQAAAVEGNQGNLLLAAAAVESLGYKAGCCSFSILSDAATLNVLVM